MLRFFNFMSYYFGQNESCKRKLHDLTIDSSICFLSCDGLHDQKKMLWDFLL